MKFKILTLLLTMSVISLTACSKNKEEAEYVKVESAPPEVIEKARQEAQQAPVAQEITDEEREHGKKELQDPSRFKSLDTTNKSPEELEQLNIEMINQLDSIGQPAKQ